MPYVVCAHALINLTSYAVELSSRGRIKAKEALKKGIGI